MIQYLIVVYYNHFNTFVNYVKTSTGFNGNIATKEAVKLINDNKEDYIEIKASGGIDSLSKMEDMINNGATKIGTSHGVKIMKEGN